MTDSGRPKVSNAAFAEGFASLFDVVQRGVRRRATAADLLELLEPPRYVLKREKLYLGEAGWSRKQRDAFVLAAVEDARGAQEIGRQKSGVETRIVRVRRKGTMGIEGYAMREGLKVTDAGGLLGIGGIGDADAMAMLASLVGGGGNKGTG
jgi:hypothetical protein